MKFSWKLHGIFGCHSNRSGKNSNDISYETTESILMKFHCKHFYDVYIKGSEKGHDPKFQVVAMPIYDNNH